MDADMERDLDTDMDNFKGNLTKKESVKRLNVTILQNKF
jgi:hypothetical protein